MEPAAPTPSRIPWRLLAGWGLAALVLLGVFGMYLHPDFMMTLGNQIWACF